MKRILVLLLALAAVLCSCTTPGIYILDENLPVLIDPSTQYPYTEKITVTDHASGKVLEFTDGISHDQIRMRLEGIRCIREKDDGSYQLLYTVEFTTTEGIVTLGIAFLFVVYGCGCYSFSLITLMPVNLFLPDKYL